MEYVNSENRSQTFPLRSIVLSRISTFLQLHVLMSVDVVATSTQGNRFNCKEECRGYYETCISEGPFHTIEMTIWREICNSEYHMCCEVIGMKQKEQPAYKQRNNYRSTTPPWYKQRNNYRSTTPPWYKQRNNYRSTTPPWIWRNY